jgi:alpha-tubulin suppressor-like RCC1 family protein
VSLDPAATVPDTDWTHVSTSRDTSCGLKSNGRLYCWGVNSNLQAGRPTTGNVLVPSPIEASAGVAASDWKRVVVGLTSCALKQDDTLHCWGRNTDGQLADGTTTQSAYTKAILPGSTWSDVAVGFLHVCGVKKDGTVWCWGRNASAQIAPGLPARLVPPTQVGSDTDWVAIAAGLSHTCGLKQSGELRCWGARLFGQTGDGALGYAPTPVPAGAGLLPASIDGYGETACALDAAGAPSCWGNAEFGQTGDGVGTSREVPTPIPQAPSFSRLAVGRFHACGVPKAGGLVQCTGLNSSGALGTGNTTQKLAFTPIASNAAYASLGWQAIDAGESHSCAIASDGSLWCWGSNCHGQVDGASTAGSFSSPVKMLPALGNGWSAVATGASHTCATRTDGALYCWGRNQNGQGGFGAATTESGCVVKVAPQLVGAGYSTKLGLGLNHSCAVKLDGSLWCWGGNSSSQLGDNTTTQANAPLRVGVDSDWVEVRAGNASTCARKASGSVWCWGSNTFGQLGVGDLGTRKVPALVSMDAHSELFAGYGSACAIRAGALHCWGSGELGHAGLELGWIDAPARVAEAL